jgi:hypothetical protein
MAGMGPWPDANVVRIAAPVECPDLVEMDLFDGDTVRRSLGLGETLEDPGGIGANIRR